MITRFKNYLQERPWLRRVLIVGFIAALAFGFVLTRTFSASNEEAVSSMTPAERNRLEAVRKIRRGMSFTDVQALLGKPDREALGLRPTWRIEGSPINQIAIYFDANGARQVRWMALGRFLFEERL